MRRPKFLNKSHRWSLEYGEEGTPAQPTLRLRRSRYWKDACSHSEESYVGSAWFVGHSAEARPARECMIDVYVFHDSLMNAQSVCIRCSDAAPDYIAPGTVLDLIVTAQKSRPSGADHYSAAACVIDRFMEVRATPRP